MKDVHRAKAEFTRRHLQPLLEAADPKIRLCIYSTTEARDGRVTAENIIIYRERRDFAEEEMRINVTGDSEKQMTLDVLKAMAKEWGLVAW